MKVHAAIARALSENDVDSIFGLIGDANLFMVDSFVRDQQGKFTAAANELGAALMALGYAAVTGKPGVVSVTHGPAVVNTMTALVEGCRGRLPLVLLCGDTAVEDRDSIQKAPHRELIVATGAGFEQLRAPHTATRDVATVLWRAQVERRPIALNIPVNFQWLDVDYESATFVRPDTRAFVPDGDDMDHAIGIIAAARRPIVLAGRGAASLDARASLLRLAERIDAPVATTLKCKGMFRGHPRDLGLFGTLSGGPAVAAIAASDCIISFGASLSPFTTARGALLSGKRVVQINLDPHDIGRHLQPRIGLVGDPTRIADRIITLLDQAEIPASGFFDFLSANAADNASSSVPDSAQGFDLPSALSRLNRDLPQNRILVTDAGRFALIAWPIMDVPDPESFVYTLNFGSIGLGLAHAIGAAVAKRERPVVLITGDGGFMLGGLVEFNTAVREKLDLIVVVCNDRCYGAEYIQFRARQLDPSITLFDWPDFAEVARALGGRGVRVATRADLDTAAEAIRVRDRPILIDLLIDPSSIPEIHP